MNVLCSTCDAEWVPVPGIVFHDDDCPRLAAIRAHDDKPCQAAAVGFCGCGRCAA